MKVILLKDIKGTGKKGDVIEASDGFARNFLLPKNLAEEANASNVHTLNLKKEAERRKKIEETEQAQRLADELKGKVIKISAKAGNNGRLFGAITSKDIAVQIKNQLKVEVDKKKVVTDTIRQLGDYDIELKLYPEISTKIKVSISDI
ncbi:50S ribosomal protein L9 [Clostridium hydrogenum]|uniref:50S ribosomal protein L9 n=1 Tax=Clostridium hydrogenum TaxID=2855764 RepID=UPI001F2CA449|nr:50S ribosomal protein L9 [Clostridium hydrogenum]